jgi:P4 family phage/plasmid primase-like protien
MATFLSIATPLIERGIPVIPVQPNEKRCLLPEWQKKATTDIEQVKLWHRDDPDFNVGCVGTPEGVVILDSDSPELIDRIERETGQKMPRTFTVRSGGKKLPHLYFRQTDASRRLGNRSRAGMFDLQSVDRYVVGAGSTLGDGKTYEVADDSPIAEFPDWLAEWIERNADAGKEKHGGKGAPVHEDFDFDRFCDHFDFGFVAEKDGRHFFEACPFKGDHHTDERGKPDYKACAILYDGETIGFSDFASSCEGYGKTIRDLIEHRYEQGYQEYDGEVFIEEEPIEELLEAFGAESEFGAAGADECTPCIHFGGSSHTHTRIESLPKMYTSPTPDFYPVEWSEQKSDKGNAELLARYFGNDILLVPEAGKAGGYYVWTGTHWGHDKGNAAMYRMAAQMTGVLLVHASKQETADQREDWASYAISCGNAGKLKNMIELVRTHVRTVHKSEFNNQRMLLNLREGTVDLKTGAIRPHDRNDLLTKCQSIPWNPAAECKRWLQFLNEVFEGNQEIVDFIRRAVGYTLTGLTREEVIFIGWGTGRNGKGKFTDTLIALMGDYARPAKFDMFVAKKADEGKANDVAELFGARFVPASEGEQSKRLAEAKIKNMVSGDPVEGEKKYQDSFTYYPEYKIWLFTNYKPRIVGTDEGIWDKVIFIPFKRYFALSERDHGLLEKLKAELPGILQWAIRGCLDWQEQGLNVPECLKQATEDYRREQNVLGHFVEDELVEHDELKTPCGRMYSHYKEWADKNGEYQMTASEFKERMQQRYGEPRRASAGKFWVGVGVKQLLSEEDKWMLEGKTVEDVMSAIQ